MPWKRLSILGCGSALLTALLVGLLQQSQQKTQTVAQIQQPLPKRETRAVPKPSVPVSSAPAQALPAPQIEKLALNEYPLDIQTAVRKAFYEPISELEEVPNFPAQPKPTVTPVQQSAPEDQQQQSQPEETPAQEYVPPPPTPNDQDLEARREQLREAFRQAIIRAQQRRMMEQQMLGQ